jgi:hypothetical protein
VDLDAGSENPESRPFRSDILAEVTIRRRELLAALLTIWRWGRMAANDNIEAGLSLGSFGQWSRWVRDPLRALGCQDPVERIGEAKQRDGRHQVIADLFSVRWEKHGAEPTTVHQLHDCVKKLADPHDRGRQFLTSYFEKLAGTRVAGFVLTRQPSPGKWGAATYALERTTADRHREHRGHQVSVSGANAGNMADAPDGPYALAVSSRLAVQEPSSPVATPPMPPMHAEALSPDPVASPAWRLRL